MASDRAGKDHSRPSADGPVEVRLQRVRAEGRLQDRIWRCTHVEWNPLPGLGLAVRAGAAAGRGALARRGAGRTARGSWPAAPGWTGLPLRLEQPPLSALLQAGVPARRPGTARLRPDADDRRAA